MQDSASPVTFFSTFAAYQNVLRHMEAFTFDNTEKILLASTGILFIVQTLYYYCLYNRIHARNKAVKRGDIHFSQELPPVSVIICAREESENLRRNLSGILEQDYPQFEVIVINDGDTDESEDYLTLLEEKYPHLYHSFVPDSSRYISRKKLAVTLGIKASKYEWLVFTDAKCLPQSNQWLRLMARNFTSRAQVVLGYSGYECGKGWLQRQICFDNLFTSMRYLGLALAGKPYMGIGRNLAYRKELFYQQKGFSAHLNLQRGDDDLFINHVATSENTRVETDADATMRMQPLTRSKDWREEKNQLCFHCTAVSRLPTLDNWIRDIDTIGFSRNLDSLTCHRHPEFPLAGSRHRFFPFHAPLHAASRCHQQSRTRSGRKTEILLHTAHIRFIAAHAVITLEAVMHVAEKKRFPEKVILKRHIRPLYL